MRATVRPPKRPPVAKRGILALPDGVGGTIAGGPMRPLDLTETLNRLAPSAGLGGAASWFAGGARPVREAEQDVALSDGSRIIFAAVAGPPIPADA